MQAGTSGGQPQSDPAKANGNPRRPFPGPHEQHSPRGRHLGPAAASSARLPPATAGRAVEPRRPRPGPGGLRSSGPAGTASAPPAQVLPAGPGPVHQLQFYSQDDFPCTVRVPPLNSSTTHPAKPPSRCLLPVWSRTIYSAQSDSLFLLLGLATLANRTRGIDIFNNFQAFTTDGPGLMACEMCVQNTVLTLACGYIGKKTTQ
nr:atrophin-1-like [Microcebus murinus]